MRYYEAQGLLTPGCTLSGYWEYTDDDVVTVRQVRRLLEAGLSTEQIAFLQPCTAGETPELDPCQETLDTLSMRLAELDRRIDTLVGTRQALSTSSRPPRNAPSQRRSLRYLYAGSARSGKPRRVTAVPAQRASSKARGSTHRV